MDRERERETSLRDAVFARPFDSCEGLYGLEGLPVASTFNLLLTVLLKQYSKMIERSTSCDLLLCKNDKGCTY